MTTQTTLQVIYLHGQSRRSDPLNQLSHCMNRLPPVLEQAWSLQSPEGTGLHLSRHHKTSVPLACEEILVPTRIHGPCLPESLGNWQNLHLRCLELQPLPPVNPFPYIDSPKCHSPRNSPRTKAFQCPSFPCARHGNARSKMPLVGQEQISRGNHATAISISTS